MVHVIIINNLREPNNNVGYIRMLTKHYLWPILQYDKKKNAIYPPS